MKRLLTASVALVLANASIAPVLAESLPQQTNPATKQQLTNPATKQQLTNPATKQQLIVPEGQMMTDAELAKVEGDVWITPTSPIRDIWRIGQCVFQQRCIPRIYAR